MSRNSRARASVYVRVRALLVVSLLAAALGAPARAQQEQWTPELQRVNDVEGALLDLVDADLPDADVERRALIAWRLWSWVATEGELTRPALRRAEVPDDEAARALLLAVESAPPTLPALDVLPARMDVLQAALRELPGRDPLGEATRYLRFTDALERMPDLDAARAALAARAPGHPWLAAVSATLTSLEAAKEMVGVIERLGHPDPTRHTRCTVTFTAPPPGPGWDERALTITGWLLAQDAREVVIWDEVTAQRSTIARTEATRVVIANDLDRWLVTPSSVWDASVGDPEACLGHYAATLVRAAWAVRGGRPLLACRLVGLVHWEHDLAVALVREELAALREHQALEALCAGAPRAELAEAFAAVADVLGPVRSVADRAPLSPAIVARDHARALFMRDALRAQAEEDARRPAPPSWEEWTRWSPEQRLACALAHLRDQSARPLMDPGGCDPLSSEQGFPPGAPPRPARPGSLGEGRGTSPADRLIELGDLAVPALIELLADDRPTRSVEGPFALSLGDVAARALAEMWQAGLFERPDHHAGKDPGVARRKNQEVAREWLARWKTLGAWHAARISTVRQDYRKLDHAVALLRYDLARARELLPGALDAIGELRYRVDLVRSIAGSADPGFADLHRRLLAGADGALAFEGALGLLRLGDRSALPRALELARSSDGVSVFRVAEAGAPDEAGRLLLDLTDHDQEPGGGDWQLGVSLYDCAVPEADALLVLARIVTRTGWSETWVDALRSRAGVAAVDTDAVTLAALLHVVPALEGRTDRQVHAAVTALGLGIDAALRFEAASGVAVRPLLLRALASGDREGACTEALGRGGAATVAWACEGAADADRARLARAALRASLRVREASGEVPIGPPFDRPWEPASVDSLLAKWRAGTPSSDQALELTVERAADLAGVRVRAILVPPTGPAVTARVEAPGLAHDGPVDDLGALMRELEAALRRAPAEPARLRLVVPR